MADLLYEVEEKPPLWMSIFLGLQHVLLILSGVVVVPAIVAKTGNVPPDQLEFVAFASIMVSSISTLIQVCRFGRVGSGYVLFMGTSGAFISCSLAAVQLGGFALVATMSILAAPLEFLVSASLRHLRHIITPVVGGAVIMLVAVNLLPIGTALWSGYPGTPHYGSFENFMVGVITVVVIFGLATFGNVYLRLWAPIIGTVIGYLAAGHYGILDMAHFRDAPFFGLPRGHWPGIELQLTATHLPLLVAFCMTTLTGTIESSGTAMAVQRVSKRQVQKIDYDSMQGCLYADGLGNLMAGLAGTVPNTTYSSTIPVLELTGVAARRVGIAGAFILGLLAFFPKLAGIIIDTPGPVMGASLVLFMAILFSTGIELAMSEGLNYQTSLLLGISLSVGIIMENKLFFHDAIPPSFEPFLGNGIATGGLTAFLLSMFFRLTSRPLASLKLPPTPESLPRLMAMIASLGDRLHLDEKHVLRMQLTCEEVFIYICGQHHPHEDGAMVHFRWSREGPAVRLEIQDRAVMADVDLPRVPTDLAKAGPDELVDLGLLLLAKLADEVRHVRIDGFNYISFIVPAH